MSDPERSAKEMYLERKDARGFVIFLSIISYLVALGFAYHTVSVEPGAFEGRRIAGLGHTGDQSLWRYFWLFIGVGTSLALFARVRSFW
jgi:hypothetical protein